ncbi:tudor domain-containing protein 7B-like isoform X1 [Dermacentor albipictus]|uniref:tudor domain-containing protein 7B-like isoform X1 n=1 Tax=Dermacentor albipictus TaxID=60249 RepID=UPI0038FC568A
MEVQKKQEVETCLHSVLSCEKGGIPLSKLQEEYTVLIGSPIPFEMLGFEKLIDYIESIPDTAAIRKSADNGTIIVQPVCKPTTAHVSQLVAGQKIAAKTKPARRPSRHPAPRTGPSVRFASYQSRLDSQKPSTIAATLSPMPLPPRRTHRGTGRGLPQLRQPSTKPGFKYEVPPRWQRPSNGFSPVLGSSSPPGNGVGEPVSRAPLRMPRTASDGSTLQPAATPMPPPPPKLPTPPATPPAPKTCRELVEEYGQSRGVTVSFSALSSRSSKKGPLVWLATLKVDVQSFYSYPDEKESREEAEEEAARKAVYFLGLNDGLQSQMQETSVSTPKQVEDFVGRIKELVSQKSNGLWSTVVPQMYQEQYKESVPKNWLELVKDSRVVCTTDCKENRCILYPQTNSPTTSQTGHRRSVTDAGPVHGPVPDKLPLPEGNHWDVFITYAASTADVFFRLLDFTDVPNITYDQYEQLTEEMDKFYAEHSLPVSEAKKNWLYATNVEDNWMRVQVLEVQDGKAECFFLDHGDVDSVPVHKLQELDPKFLNLPFQIVHCQLDDLGDFADDEQANKLLNELFVGKCLIAEVSAREPVVTAIFYDTTTDEDVNLNALLLKRLETPVLPGPEQITRVRLGHIDSEGNLYVQLQGSGLSRVTRFMEIVGSHIRQNNHQPASSLCESKLYACRLKDSVTFCRALLLSAARTKDDKVLVRLVDIGKETLVSASNLYELDIFGESFVSFPHQAIICRLADVAPGLWTLKATSLLREMVPSDLDLLLKVVRPAKDGSEPLVAMFKRIGPNNELVSVNTSLAVALESSKQEERKAKRVPALTRVSSQTFSEKKVEEKKFDEKKAESKKTEQKKPEAATNGGSGDFSPPSKVSASASTIGPSGDGPGISSITSPSSELAALSLMSSPELDEEGLQGKPLAAPELPGVGDYLDVNVTEAANPLNFTCQSWTHGAQLDALMSEMQSFYAAEGSSAFPEGLPEALLRKGRYYAGRHMDKCWYRVLVQQVQGPLMASVYFVDYGDYGMMQPSELQPLWQRFRHLPVQAIQASLAGVEPVQNDWNPVDCINFRNIVKDRQFVARIVAKRPDTKTGVEGAQHLVVRLVDTSSSDDVHIDQLLAERSIVRLVST